jgi:glucokinase
MAPIAIGVDIGATKIAAAVVNAGRLGEVRSVATPSGASAILDTVARLVRTIEPGPRVPLGIASAGAIDDRAGVVVSATATIPGWAGTGLGEELRARLPEAPTIATLNDVRAHALGEAWVGAGRSAGSALVIAVGTGIGAALVVDNRIESSGAHHLAGAIAHIPTRGGRGYMCPCGREGHLEAVASGPGLVAIYERASGLRAANGREVAERADAGEPEARRAIRRSAELLGRTLSGVISTLDPEIVIVAGGLAELGHGWWAGMTSAVEREAPPPLAATPIVRAELGPHAAVVGAAYAALCA